MREAHPHPHDQTPTIPVAEPQSELARRLASGASVQEMMRRGEIGGQALGLVQMMAAAQTETRPHAYARGSVETAVGTN